MLNKLCEWIWGNSSVDFCREKQTPETNPIEALPQPEVLPPKESALDKMCREQKERKTLYIKELQQKVDELILTEEEFSVGDRVQYVKVPNDSVEFYVTQYYHAYVSKYHFVHIELGEVTVQYFDANQILRTITDKVKWFKKV
jgi:hypothetical protein